MESKIRQPIITVAGHVDHGKCVSGDTLIPLADGTIITAKELFDNNFIKSKAKKQDGDIVQEINNITLFSSHGQAILPTKASHIWKRRRKDLIEIKTAHGDLLKTTPEHPYFKFSLEGNIKTKADELEVGDFIAVPSQIKTNNSNPKLIIFEGLKNSDFLCFLNSRFEVLKNRIKTSGIKKIGEKLSIKHLSDSLIKSRIRFKDLVKIGEHFKIPDEKLYDMIEALKNSSNKQRAGHTSKTIKLPDAHDPEKVGYVLGCIAGDGHLSKTQVLFDNNDKELQDSYSSYLKEIFNIDSFVKQNHTCQTVVNNAGLTFNKFLKEVIGFPDKQKSEKINVIKLAKTNKDIFRGFFAGLIDTDGYVSKINNCIELTSKSKLLINECSILLLNFGIQSVVYEKNGFHVLRIANKKYLDRFLNSFRPRLKRKLERVIKASKKAKSSRIFDIYPIPKEELKRLKLPGKINRFVPYYNKYIKNQNLTEEFLKKVIKNLKEENQASLMIKQSLERDTSYVRVVSKNKIKNLEDYVYDFTVPETHNFIAQRTIVHNTSILDCFRGSSIQAGESGGITQKISFTKFPKEQIYKASPLIKKAGIELTIPGFLFIDTPGHAAFTNLRKRGGSLADLAILVVDIKEGIKPQTAEVISILKSNKTPFIVALNKIDTISGWQARETIKESIENLPAHVRQEFDTQLLTFQGSLQSHGYESSLFYEVEDFTKQVAIVPCSARTKQGIPELLLALSGLSQKYLTKRLELSQDAKGVILEIKKDKAIENIESILYDGFLKEGDEIAIATLEGETLTTKIRAIQEILPLSSKYSAVKEAGAATGVRIQVTNKEGLVSGMPFQKINQNLQAVKEQFKKEISQTLALDKEGIIAKADSLGSLEALLTLLKQSHIQVVKAGIGPITKKDVISAKTNLKINPLNAIIVGFNVEPEEDLELGNTKLLTDEVVYKLIENLELWRKEKSAEIERERLMGLATICKLEILHNYVFRNLNPAIFGVRVSAGKLKAQTSLIDEDDEQIARVKSIQADKSTVDEAEEGKEVAISLPGVNFERRLKEKKYLYSNISESQFKAFKKNKDLLSSTELKTLQEIAEIKSKKKDNWGG